MREVEVRKTGHKETDDKRLEIRLIEKEEEEEIKKIKKKKKKVSEETETESSLNEEPLHEWTVRFYTKEVDEKPNEKNSILQLKIVGEKGKSRKFKFSTGGKAFQRGKVIETFKIKTTDIGAPKYVILTNTGEGDIPELRFEKVELHDGESLFEFPHDQWIEKDQVVTLKVMKNKKGDIYIHLILLSLIDKFYFFLS
jgi:hypothetical protein